MESAMPRKHATRKTLLQEEPKAELSLEEVRPQGWRA
jgi:hypothetical protein